MAYSTGLKALHRLCVDQSPLAWQHAKLTPALFKTHEQPIFSFLADHLRKHHSLPKIETVQALFPDMVGFETPEPASYYVQNLENQYFYDLINAANLDSQTVLKANQDAHELAVEILNTAINKIKIQKYKNRIMDVGKEAGSAVIQAYHDVALKEPLADFGWPYMDVQSSSIQAGDLVSFVGRPSLGKTYNLLWIAIHNWRSGRNVIFVSMEMTPLAIAQRVAAMYTSTGISQLKLGAFSGPTYNKFSKSVTGLAYEKAKFYIVDGNLASNVDDIYSLADQLKCKIVLIDGAYLVRHSNDKLDRYRRVAENCELMKRYTNDLSSGTIASFQFSREGSQKSKKGKGEVTLDDIGYSDVIGQVSSIILGLFQEEGVEVTLQRKIRILKGRDGQTGDFSINWDFEKMDFRQCFDPHNLKEEDHVPVMFDTGKYEEFGPDE